MDVNRTHGGLQAFGETKRLSYVFHKNTEGVQNSCGLVASGRIQLEEDEVYMTEHKETEPRSASNVVSSRLELPRVSLLRQNAQNYGYHM